jgi:hypothetical protein
MLSHLGSLSVRVVADRSLCNALANSRHAETPFLDGSVLVLPSNGLKPVDRKVVRVRLPPSAPIISINYAVHSSNLKIMIFTDQSLTRVSIAIQFTSQFFPPSAENDCSKRHEFGVMSEITKRTKMARPLKCS